MRTCFQGMRLPTCTLYLNMRNIQECNSDHVFLIPDSSEEDLRVKLPSKQGRRSRHLGRRPVSTTANEAQ